MEHCRLRFKTVVTVFVCAFLCLGIFDLVLTQCPIRVRNASQLISINDIHKQLQIFKSQQKARKSANNQPKNITTLQYSYVPQVICPTMVRLGDVVDGGKWVCNPWLAPTPCIIFSLGVSGDASFESDMQKWVPSKCSVYGFDDNITHASTYNTVPNSQFFDYRISGTTDEFEKTYTVQALAKKLNVARIDFLKIDIESSEFSVIPTLFESDGITLTVPICQLMIELHPFFEVDVREWTRLLTTLENGQFLLFQRESNAFCNPPCFEYAWIHKHCLSDYHVLLPVLFNNF